LTFQQIKIGEEGEYRPLFRGKARLDGRWGGHRPLHVFFELAKDADIDSIHLQAEPPQADNTVFDISHAMEKANVRLERKDGVVRVGFKGLLHKVAWIGDAPAQGNTKIRIVDGRIGGMVSLTNGARFENIEDSIPATCKPSFAECKKNANWEATPTAPLPWLVARGAGGEVDDLVSRLSTPRGTVKKVRDRDLKTNMKIC
jgi:hypothetical protein